MKTLTHEQARRAYDRIGAWQDTQAFYEDVATARLREHAELGSAKAVFEFGCGTGRFAETLLRDHLTPSATYRGVDLSPRMVELATARLSPYADRAVAALSTGDPPTGEPDASCDRFVSSYVFDLLSADEIAAVVTEAHRMLHADGLLCLTSLSTGRGAGSRAVARAWSFVHRLNPGLVGGCRPIELLRFLDAAHWRIQHREVVTPFGLPSEVIVAARCLDYS
ncbi:MAG: class I SAM-dependent methyltransferase [Myxococcales bacterium]|nr:MAG: class I SAM-dependent methyltransferase [Myxococcales bacterium]